MTNLFSRGRAAVSLAFVLLASLWGCSAPSVDLASWRARESVQRPESQRAAIAADVERIERLRAADELAEARRLALQLAAEHPEDGRVIVLASRAESDGVFTFPESDKDSRNHAAASSLEYAERALRLGQTGPAAEAQLAWALGTTTHLQSMGDRSGHARRTQEVADRVLAADPLDPTALATLAVLNLRLETLPWIANLMASGLPDSSLEDAERYARRAVAARPSRECKQILAKVLIAMDREDEARSVLEEALAAGAAFPRDRVLESAIRRQLEDL